MPTPTKKRGLATGIYSATVVLLVGLILAAGNFLSSRVLARIDLTQDREFTVSKATREVLRGLDDIVTVKVYFSKRLPPNLATLRRNIDDVLREFQAYSHGKVRVEYIDPAEKPEEEQKLRFLGIPQVQLNVLEKDQLQVINGYMGIAMLYADRHQAIPIVQDINTLEYDLTAFDKYMDLTAAKIGKPFPIRLNMWHTKMEHFPYPKVVVVDPAGGNDAPAWTIRPSAIATSASRSTGSSPVIGYRKPARTRRSISRIATASGRCRRG